MNKRLQEHHRENHRDSRENQCELTDLVTAEEPAWEQARPSESG